MQQHVVSLKRSEMDWIM